MSWTSLEHASWELACADAAPGWATRPAHGQQRAHGRVQCTVCSCLARPGATVSTATACAALKTLRSQIVCARARRGSSLLPRRQLRGSSERRLGASVQPH